MKVGIAERKALRAYPAALDTIEAEACLAYPHEACGLLIGKQRDAGAVVMRAVGCANLAGERRADRYELDPDDFRAADDAARRDGLDIVGVWHSHPDHPARPSPTDLEAAWPGYVYLIVSVGADGVGERRAWRLGDDDFIEEEIHESEPEVDDLREIDECNT